MDGNRSFRNAVEAAGKNVSAWKYAGSGQIFTKDELLSASALYDETFPETTGPNMFVFFPGGEIGLLSTEDNTVEILFTPV